MKICSLLVSLVLVGAIATASAQDVVVQDGVKYIKHNVKRGETLYALSRKYDVKIEDITNANKELSKGLKVGQEILIPYQSPDAAPSHAEVSSSAPTVTVAAEPYAEVPQVQTDLERAYLAVFEEILSDLRIKSNQQFRTLPSQSTAEVALLLPLGSIEQPAANYLDFYRGFLLGLEKVRLSGRSVNLNLVNTARSHDRMATIIQSGMLHRADLIVGPIYEDEMQVMLAGMEDANVPIVSPLTNLSQTSSNSVFQMSPLPTARLDKVKELFDGSRRVVVIYTDNVDTKFTAEVLSMIKPGVQVVEHKYVYQHASEVSKTSKSSSPSDLTPLLRGKEPTVFVITSSNGVEVDRILTALTSAKISLTARSQSVVPFVVYGNNRWSRHTNLDKTLYFNNNVVMLSKYHASRSDANTRAFNRLFVREFGDLPTLFAYRGYDAAVVFVSALYDGIGNGLEGAHVTPLLTPYHFEVDAATGVRKNNQWVKVTYNSDFTITAE